METVLFDWPLVTPLAASALLVWSFTEQRAPGSGSRWHDPAFLLPLLWPMYLVHQFEEHGYDVHGNRFAFLGSMCHSLGFDSVSHCPADEPFIFAVNVIACPVAFLLPYVFRHTRPLLAAIPWGVPLINAWAHLATAAREGAYNPGLLTSVSLFLPLTFWVLRVLVQRKVIKPAHITWVAGSGVALHVVLIGSVQLRAHGWVNSAGLFVINAFNGLVPLFIGWWPSRRRATDVKAR